MTFDFFFYGTLLDDDVRETVIGRVVAGEPAALPKFEVVPAAGGRYPFVVPRPDAETPGQVFRGLSLAEAARLSFYENEGPKYSVRRLAVRLAEGATAKAWIYFATAAVKRGTGAWDPAAWKRVAKPEFLAWARRTMRAMPPAELVRYETLWRKRG